MQQIIHVIQMSISIIYVVGVHLLVEEVCHCIFIYVKGKLLHM